MDDFYTMLAELEREGVPLAVATVVRVRGSDCRAGVFLKNAPANRCSPRRVVPVGFSGGPGYRFGGFCRLGKAASPVGVSPCPAKDAATLDLPLRSGET